MKAFSLTELKSSLKSLESDFDVRVPIALHDGTRTLGSIDSGELHLAGGTLPTKPVSLFFPQIDCIMTVEDDSINMQHPVEKPLLIVGFTAEDADCLEFTDKFFSSGYYDNIYFNKREDAMIGVISGHCGENGNIMKLSSGNCDFELICNEKKYIAVAHSQPGKNLLQKFTGGVEVKDSIYKNLKKETKNLSADNKKLIDKASKLLLDGAVPEQFWQEIASRCIACTACNLVCPTCTCFEVFDTKRDKLIERYRMWDSCQFDSFMREASGHNPMNNEHIRTRRRIHHKLGADVTHWGSVTCFLCGRCDDACPSDIGIISVCREMIELYDTK